MNFKNYPLNRFDRIMTAEDALPVLRNGFEKTGFSYEIVPVFRYTPAIETFYNSLSIPDLSIGVNGKGSTETIALASLFGEACERIQTCVNMTRVLPEFIPYVRHQVGARKDLPGYRNCHETELQGKYVPIEKYLQGAFYTDAHLQMIRDGDLGRHWVMSQSLISGDDVLIPSKMTGLWNGSNGLSAGVTIEEAIIQGTSEVFERYATWQFLKGRGPWPIIPIHCFSAEVQSLTERVERNGYKIVYRDFSEGKGYPTIGAFIECLSEPMGRASRVYLSWGSSPDMNYAAERCVTEYFQGWERHITTLRQIPTIPYSRWSGHPQLYNSNYFAFLGDLKYFDKYTDTSSGWKAPEKTTTAYLQYFIDRIQEFGSDLLVVDSTKSWCGVPTVRIVVPGMSELIPVMENFQAGDKAIHAWYERVISGFRVLDNWHKYANRFGLEFDCV